MRGRPELDYVRFLRPVAADVDPADVGSLGKLALGCQPVVPLAAAGCDDRLPSILSWDGELDLSRSLLQEASRATVCTSFTPSNFSIRRESCASESISTVADTTAVLSSYTWTSRADMLTRFSATTVAMSRIRPCRSQASILIATG